jgi:hypothetical protein
LRKELLAKTEELDETDNDFAFVEQDTPISREAIEDKIQILRDARHADSDDKVRDALHAVAPTYKTPEEINADAINANEMTRHQQAVSV